MAGMGSDLRWEDKGGRWRTTFKGNRKPIGQLRPNCNDFSVSTEMKIVHLLYRGRKYSS